MNASSKDERTFAMLCHLLSFSGFVIPFGNILAPLIIWLVKREEYPMVDDQGKESLNFQISFTIYFLISFLMLIPAMKTPGLLIALFILWCFLGIAYLVLIVIATIKTNDGIAYRYPAVIRFL